MIAPLHLLVVIDNYLTPCKLDSDNQNFGVLLDEIVVGNAGDGMDHLNSPEYLFT